jgi:integrase
MQKELIDLFETLPKRSEWVFYQANGEPFKQWHIHKPFKKVLKAIGIDARRYSWKELRHTTASLMHRKGVPTLAIKDQLRHSNMKTTVDFYIGSDMDYRESRLKN